MTIYAMTLERLQLLVDMKYVLFSGGPTIRNRTSSHFNEHKAVHYVLLNLFECDT